MSQPKEVDSSADHSDSDDWTLISSPQREQQIPEPKLESIHSNSSSCSSLEQTEDGLLEIDLNETNEAPSEVNSISDKETQVQNYSGDESHLSENEDGLNDEPSGLSCSATELCEMRKRLFGLRGLREDPRSDLALSASNQSSDYFETAVLEDRPLFNINRQPVMKPNASRSSPVSNNGMSDPLLSLFAGSLALIVTFIVFFLCLIAIIPIEYVSETSAEKVCYKYVGPVDRLGPEDGISPKQHHFDELKSLHTDLSNCIRRQNPTSFTYYMSPERALKDSRPPLDIKPYRGLVCYEQETKWRKRIKRMKSEHGIDLIALTQEVKRRVTNEIVQLRGDLGTTSDKLSQLDLNLILNQIEYLDYVERERNRRRLEESLKHITVENMQLARRLKRPTSEPSNQRSFVSVEIDNVRLQRENAKLKASLMEKVGPIYMKQALELEGQERENIALKKFYHQVAQDVSKSLKQFNLHTVDTPNIIDDDENLNSQLMLTRGHLRRLTEKISSVLIENEGLKDELKEIYLMNVHNKDNLPAIKSGSDDDKYNDKNGTDVLVADSCLRSLVESIEKSSKLESELEDLKRNCSNRNVDLERSPERRLHKPGDNASIEQRSSIERKMLTSASRTELDKRTSDISSMRTEDMIDELILFLTKFNEQIESKSLARVEDSSQVLATFKEGLEKKEVDNSKVIPVYIREAIRSVRSSITDYAQTSPASGLMNSGSHIRLPPTPPSMCSSRPAFDKINASRGCLDPPPHKDKDQNIQVVYSLFENHTLTEPMGDVYATTTDTLSDSWFFKRAKQRKDLRRADKSADHQVDWLTKRAKLREKLRKASTYIDKYYKPSEYRIIRGQYLPQNRRLYEYTAQHDAKRSRNQGHNNKKNKSSKQHRRDRQKYIRDEI